MALGKFADLSEEEFERVHLRYRPSAARVAPSAIRRRDSGNPGTPRRVSPLGPLD